MGDRDGNEYVKELVMWIQAERRGSAGVKRNVGDPADYRGQQTLNKQPSEATL